MGPACGRLLSPSQVSPLPFPPARSLALTRDSQCSPLIDNTPLNAVQSRFFTELIRDSLVEYSYDADLAGLSYTFSSEADGIVLTLDGYNDKLHVLARVVFEKIRSLQVDPKRFEIIKDQVRLLRHAHASGKAR